MVDGGEQVESLSWWWRMGLRYVFATASLLVFVLLAFEVLGDAGALRGPLMAGFVSILVLVLAIPIQVPRGENEKFKTFGSLGTAGAFAYIAWLSVDEEIKALLKGHSADVETAWWIILGYFIVGLIGGFVIVFSRRLALSLWSSRKRRI